MFSLGRFPDDAKGRHRAEDLAERLHAHLDGGTMTYGEAGQAIGVNPNALRYAATTGTVAIRWSGARLPTVWTLPQPEIGPFDARLELARRYLHVYGPTTSAAFAKWAGITTRMGAAAFEALAGALAAVRTPIGESFILGGDEQGFRTDPVRQRRLACCPAETPTTCSGGMTARCWCPTRTAVGSCGRRACGRAPC